MTTPTVRTLDVPGAVLYYEIRVAETGSEPLLLLIGSPQGAARFASLAGQFADRTVVTYDPRGSDRSVRTNAAAEVSPDAHADDLHRLIESLSARPVDVFATGGGAVNALALVTRHPNQVRTLVAHEPPAAQVLPDRELVLAACADIASTYQRAGRGPAMAKFLRLTRHLGPLPVDYAARPAPDPAEFGLPVDDDGSRDHAVFSHNLVSCTHFVYDLDALRAASTRIVLAVGDGSIEQFAYRASVAMADRLGLAPVALPGDHRGFLDDDGGAPRGLEQFASALRAVLGGP